MPTLSNKFTMLQGIEGKYIMVKQGRDRSGIRSFIIDKSLGILTNLDIAMLYYLVFLIYYILLMIIYLHIKTDQRFFY